jgi:hypothetical protein
MEDLNLEKTIATEYLNLGKIIMMEVLEVAITDLEVGEVEFVMSQIILTETPTMDSKVLFKMKPMNQIMIMDLKVAVDSEMNRIMVMDPDLEVEVDSEMIRITVMDLDLEVEEADFEMIQIMATDPEVVVVLEEANSNQSLIVEMTIKAPKKFISTSGGLALVSIFIYLKINKNKTIPSKKS